VVVRRRRCVVDRVGCSLVGVILLADAAIDRLVRCWIVGSSCVSVWAVRVAAGSGGRSMVVTLGIEVLRGKTGAGIPDRKLPW